MLFAAAVALAIALARGAALGPRRATAIGSRCSRSPRSVPRSRRRRSIVGPRGRRHGGPRDGLALGARPGALRRGATLLGAVAVTAGGIALAPMPVDVRAATEATAAIEQRFDRLVPELPVPDPALAQRIRAEVLPPLDRIRAGLADDSRMPEALAQRAGALMRYLDARRRALVAFASYLETGDRALRAAIVAADWDATAAP